MCIERRALTVIKLLKFFCINIILYACFWAQGAVSTGGTDAVVVIIISIVITICTLVISKSHIECYHERHPGLTGKEENLRVAGLRPGHSWGSLQRFRKRPNW